MRYGMGNEILTTFRATRKKGVLESEECRESNVAGLEKFARWLFRKREFSPLWRWIEFPEGKSGFSRFFLPFPPAPAFQMSSLNVQKRVREHSMFSATRHDASIRSTSLGNYRYSRKCTKIQGWRILTNIINVIINEISLEELINIFFTTLMNLVKFYRRIFNYSTVEFHGKL